MKFGFDKPYFPIQKVDNPGVVVDLKTSRSFGRDKYLNTMYSNIVQYAFNAGIRYVNKVLKKVLPDEIFNRYFAVEYIEFNKDGLYRLCEDTADFVIFPDLKKGEDYLVYDSDDYYCRVKKLKDKTDLSLPVLKSEFQKYFYRTFEEKKTPERSVPEPLYKDDTITEKDVKVWGHSVGDVTYHKWPDMDDLINSYVPGTPQKEPRPGQFVMLKVDGISDSFKKGNVVRYSGETKIKKGRVIYYFEHLLDPKNRIGFPDNELLECIDFGPSILDSVVSALDGIKGPTYSDFMKPGHGVECASNQQCIPSECQDISEQEIGEIKDIAFKSEQCQRKEGDKYGCKICLGTGGRLNSVQNDFDRKSGIILFACYSKDQKNAHNVRKVFFNDKVDANAGGKNEFSGTDIPRKFADKNGTVLPKGFYFNIDPIKILAGPAATPYYTPGVQLFYSFGNGIAGFYDTINEKFRKGLISSRFNLISLGGEIVKRNYLSSDPDDNQYILFKKDDSENYFIGRHGDWSENCPSISIKKILKNYGVSPWYFEEVKRQNDNSNKSVVSKGIVSGNFEGIISDLKNEFVYPKEGVNSFFDRLYNKFNDDAREENDRIRINTSPFKTGVQIKEPKKVDTIEFSIKIRQYWLIEEYKGLNKNTVLELMGNDLSAMGDKSPFKVLETEHAAYVGAEMRIPNKLVRIFTREEFLNIKK